MDPLIAKLFSIDELGDGAARVGPFTRVLLPAYRPPDGSDTFVIGGDGENVVKYSWNPTASPEDHMSIVPLFTVSGPPQHISRALGDRVTALLDCVSHGLPGEGGVPSGDSIFDSPASFRQFAEAYLDDPVTHVLVADGTFEGFENVIQWDRVAKEDGVGTFAYALTAKAGVAIIGSPLRPMEGTDPSARILDVPEEHIEPWMSELPIQGTFGFAAFSGQSVAARIKLR